MNVLAVETSTEYCSVALRVKGREHVREALAGQQHSAILPGMICDVLDAGGIRFDGLDGFAFGAGPGSFTGLRIGCGITQGMAFAVHKPVAGISSLLALAEAGGTEKVIAALDARMGQAYFAAYLREPGSRWVATVEPCLVDANTVPDVDGDGWCGIGSGFDRHSWLADALGPQVRTLRGRVPRAVEVARLAESEFTEGRGGIAALAAPHYVRDKVALTVAERISQAVGSFEAASQ